MDVQSTTVPDRGVCDVCTFGVDVRVDVRSTTVPDRGACDACAFGVDVQWTYVTRKFFLLNK